MAANAPKSWSLASKEVDRFESTTTSPSRCANTPTRPRDIRGIVLQKTELVGLVDHLSKLPGEASGDMRKRGGLARALVLQPKIILFDETDSGLDPVRAAYLDALVNTAPAGDGSDVLHHHPQHPVGHAHRPSVPDGQADGPIGMDEMAESDAPPGAASDDSTVTVGAAAGDR